MLGDGETWPQNGSLNYKTILQLHLYCRRLGKWTEFPYVQAFMSLYQNPALCGSGNQRPGESENSLDILDGPHLTPPNSQERNRASPTPTSTPASRDPPGQSQTSPSYAYPLYTLVPQDEKASPTGVTRSGTSYHRGSGRICPLGQVANGEGTIRVHVPFFLTDLAQCKQSLDQFSKDPSRFIEGFQALTLAFDLTWKDVQIVLSTCCTHEEKEAKDLDSSPGAC